MEKSVKINYFNIDFDKNYTFYETGHDSICVLVMGQIRNFFQEHCFTSFQEFIHRLKQEYSKVVVFFYISLKSDKPEWQYERYLNNTKTMISYDDFLKLYNYDFTIDENSFYEKINRLDITYVAHIRNKTEDDIVFKRYNNIHFIQNYYLTRCLNLVSEYEKQHDFTFDYVYKTLTDVLYKHISLQTNRNEFLFQWDFMFFCNRSISMILEDHLELKNDRYLTLYDNVNDMEIIFRDNNAEFSETHNKKNKVFTLRALLLHHIPLLILKNFDIQTIQINAIHKHDSVI